MIQKIGGGELLNLTATVSKMFESPKIIIVFSFSKIYYFFVI